MSEGFLAIESDEDENLRRAKRFDPSEAENIASATARRASHHYHRQVDARTTSLGMIRRCG
ncbi:hypothetical protein KCP69_04155 [Salmonella enterica subsp. enterica]|nr:hypothetical protein KCP69_04155 [Salmonella enterica subsp. enterica]